MNSPKCTDEDYVQYLLATPRVVSAVEASRVHREVSHDAFTRLLTRLEPDSEQLWQEVEPYVSRTQGMLVIDDSTLDKPYAKKMDLVSYHWSGKHHRAVQGINLVTLLWTDGDQHLPFDWRIYDKDGSSKNDHFIAMMRAARDRGFRPSCVGFDGWYSSLENLKLLRSFDWKWLTRLKANRLVSTEKGKHVALSDVTIAEEGTQVHLKGYGFIRVFRRVSKDGNAEHWATSDLSMRELERLSFAEKTWTIEEYHRGIKQACHIERCQGRRERVQRNHIALSIRAFVRLSVTCFRTGQSWFDAKANIVREAVRAYLYDPLYTLKPPKLTPTA